MRSRCRDTGKSIERMVEFDVSIRSEMRRSEQYNLHWPDVEFDRKIMRLHMTKNGKPRNAFIIEDVKKSLRRLKDLNVRQRAGEDKSDDLVFSKSENKKWWAVALEDAGMWHDNRHTFCSRLVQAGAPQDCPGSGRSCLYSVYDEICPLRPHPGRGRNGGPQLGELDDRLDLCGCGQPYEFRVGEKISRTEDRATIEERQYLLLSLSNVTVPQFKMAPYSSFQSLFR
jgi:Phage integrase family